MSIFRDSFHQQAAGSPADQSGSFSVKRLEVWVAIVLTAIILCCHIMRAFVAGALWRDEAAAVQLATLPSFTEVASHFQHEAFPLLFPSVIRGVAWVSGGGDMAWRWFGMLVGMAIIGALWWNLYVARRGVPTLSLALLGFNSAFIQWGDSIRGYGLGTFFILLTVGLFYRVLERPIGGRVMCCVIAAVASVQCHFHNPFLLLAIGLGAAVVTLRHKAPKQTALVLSIGCIAALSLLPYWSSLQKGRDWDILVRSPVGLGDIWQALRETLSASGWCNAWIWSLLVVLALGMVVWTQFGGAFREPPSGSQDLLLFSGIAMIIGLACHICFLEVLSYEPRPWYFMALMAFVALLLDLIFDTLGVRRWTRVVRVSVAIIIAGSSFLVLWQQLQLRQTNVDLIASRLGQVAQKEDLVVISPWSNGIPFSRYYHGQADWMTIPPIEFHKFHRYDLIKAQMVLPDSHEPLRPLLARISDTLKTGHRVWVVGELARPRREGDSSKRIARVEKQWGWRYSLAWSLEVTSQLSACARHSERVLLGFSGTVSPYENLPLNVYEGWAKP